MKENVRMCDFMSADEYDSEEGSTEESGSEASDDKDSNSDSDTEAPLLRDVEESGGSVIL